MRLGCVKIGNFDDFSTIISPKLCKMGPRLLLITNRKSHTIGTKINDLGWPWIDLERLLCALLHYTRLSEPIAKIWMKIHLYFQRQKCSPGIAVSRKITFMRIFAGVRCWGGSNMSGVVENGDFGLFYPAYLPNLHTQCHNYYIMLCSPIVALQ